MQLQDAPLRPSNIRFYIDENVSTSQNPFTGGLKTTRLSGAAWIGQCSFQAILPEESGWFDAFLASLRGGAAITRIKDFSYLHPQGVRRGSPKCRTDTLQGYSIPVDGWDPNVANQLKPGDKLSFIDPVSNLEELHIVTNVVNSNATGQSTIDIYPEIKRAISAGTAINIVDPGFSATCEKPPKGLNWSGYSASLTLTFKEALYGL